MVRNNCILWRFQQRRWTIGKQEKNKDAYLFMQKRVLGDDNGQRQTGRQDAIMIQIGLDQTIRGAMIMVKGKRKCQDLRFLGL